MPGPLNMSEKTRMWLRRWLPVILFALFGVLTLAQVWLSAHPG